MKFALTFVLVAISIAVVSADTCYTDESKCAEDECCIEVGNRLSSIWGVCLKRKQLGHTKEFGYRRKGATAGVLKPTKINTGSETCKIYQETSLMKSHVYLNSCPCAEGLKCVDKDGNKGVSGLTCFTDENKCAADECCIEVGNKVGSKWGECLKLKQLGQTCEIHQKKSLIKSHVYINSCPCAVGMKCIDKDGKGRKVLGTCQQTY